MEPVCPPPVAPIAIGRDHMAREFTHVEGTVRALAELRKEHEREASPLQRVTDRFTRRAAGPAFVILLTVIIAFWIGVNSGLLFLGKKPIDEPPFFWMQGAVSLAALYMTVLILATQRRENELASHHEHLTLELAILASKRRQRSSPCWKSSAKIILISAIALIARRRSFQSLPTRNRSFKQSKSVMRFLGPIEPAAT